VSIIGTAGQKRSMEPPLWRDRHSNNKVEKRVSASFKEGLNRGRRRKDLKPRSGGSCKRERRRCILERAGTCYPEKAPKKKKEWGIKNLISSRGFITSKKKKIIFSE